MPLCIHTTLALLANSVESTHPFFSILNTPSLTSTYVVGAQECSPNASTICRHTRAKLVFLFMDFKACIVPTRRHKQVLLYREYARLLAISDPLKFSFFVGQQPQPLFPEEEKLKVFINSSLVSHYRTSGNTSSTYPPGNTTKNGSVCRSVSKNWIDVP